MAEPLTLIRVVDTETTGIDDPIEMVEIGWTDIRLFADGWAIESGPHSRLVRPTIPISFGAMATHHITEAEASGEISQEEAKALIAGVDFYCAHNITYDARLLGSNLPWLCTFKAARTAWPEMQSHSNGAIRYELGLCLDDERAVPSHRAGPDTWVTAHILLRLLETLSVEKIREITGNPVRMLRINFGEHFGKRFNEIPFSYLDWIVNKSNMASDPKKEDVVFSARMELNERANGKPSQEPVKPQAPDPDAWRREMGGTF
jgi:exodeoxyribonuclease X